MADNKFQGLNCDTNTLTHTHTHTGSAVSGIAEHREPEGLRVFTAPDPLSATGFRGPNRKRVAVR